MDSKVLFFASIFLSLFSQLTCQTQVADLQLLQKVCADSKDKNSCLKNLQSNNLKTESLKTLKELSNVALASTKKDSAAVRDFFDAKFKATPNKAFKDCVSYFDETMKQLNIGGLEDGTASLDIHYAYDSVDYCEKALAAAKINDPAIKAKIEEWRKIYSITSSTVTAAENLV